MLLDLHELIAHPNAVNELYVAMTQANAVLWMSVPKRQSMVRSSAGGER